MRALLINEASGVHGYLKQGLEALGHEAIIGIAGSRSWQGRPADHYFDIPRNNVPLKVAANIKENVWPAWTAKRVPRADVVNFVLGMSVFQKGRNKYHDLTVFKRSGSALSHYAVGCDEVSLLRIRADASNLPCASCEAYDEMGKTCSVKILGSRPRAAEHGDSFDFSVSSAFEYSHCHNLFPTALGAKIPLPVNANAIDFTGVGGGTRPTIVHAPTRRGFKGTRVVLEAIDQLRRLTSDFEFVLLEGLSHQDYLEAMRRSDIHVDQVFTYSYGVAALESLAMGKVVFSGNRDSSRGYFPFGRESPVIDASADPRSLARSLYEVLQRREELPALGEQGRAFVERHHDHVGVAEQFVALWHSGGSEKDLDGRNRHQTAPDPDARVSERRPGSGPRGPRDATSRAGAAPRSGGSGRRSDPRAR